LLDGVGHAPANADIANRLQQQTRDRLGVQTPVCDTSRMTPTLYGIPNCDTVKKARVWLDGQGVTYAFHDYKKAGVDSDWLYARISEHGWETVLNRAGTTFRALPEDQKRDLDPRKAAALMRAQPSMIKRPILDFGDRSLVGFKPDIYASYITG